jgi:enoyl-[acyl-carrier protein] reductase I
MTPDWLGLHGRRILIFGVANRKSVAAHIAATLLDLRAAIELVVRDEATRQNVERLFPGLPIHVCDVEHSDQLAALTARLAERPPLDGLVHSIAFADYEGGVKPFHETSKAQFLRAMDVSCFSLTSIAGSLKEQLARDASVVTISISTTRMASENYGFMAPIKAALDSSLAFLAKSFSRFSEVRFNAVASGLLKTSASAGIPGYVDAYLFAEQVIPRRRALETQEVANLACFLLSRRSSGINAQSIIVDAGMSINYFDQSIIQRVVAAGPE